MRLQKRSHPPFRGVGSVLTCLVMLLMGSLWPYSEVKAARACGEHISLFDGTDPKSSSSLYGVRATINTRDTFFCTTAHQLSDASVWVMLAGGDVDQLEYAQIGWARGSGQTDERYFAEYWDDFPSFDRYTGSIASGSSDFRVNYSFSEKRMKMWRNQWLLLTTDFDPRQYWQTPWRMLWDGEVHVRGDDMPGRSDSKVTFDNLQIYPCSGCSWVQPTGLFGSSDDARYSFQWIDSNTFNIWTSSP